MKSAEIIEKIRNKFRHSDPQHRTMTCVVQFHFTDDAGNIIKSVVFDMKELQIYDGVAENAAGSITVADNDFYKVGTKQITFDDLITNHKVKINGDADAVNKMMDKFRFKS